MSAASLTGFKAQSVTLASPAVPLSDEVRARMASVLAAVVCGKTPEEITGYLRSGFPGDVKATLEREHELDEIHAHIDVLLCVSPALAAS